MAACPVHGCSGELQSTQPGLGFVRPFKCDQCGALVHSAACVDDQGQVECCCGIEEASRRREEMTQ